MDCRDLGSEAGQPERPGVHRPGWMGPGVPALAASCALGAALGSPPHQGGPVLSPGSHLSLGCQGPGRQPTPPLATPLRSLWEMSVLEAVCL